MNNEKRDFLYFIAIFLKFLAQAISMSVIPFMIGEELCQNVFKIMTYTSYLLVILSIVINPQFKMRELIIIAAIVAITVVGSYYSGNAVMLTLIYLYGARDIDIERIIRNICVWSIIVFAGIVLGSKAGIIENWDFFVTTSRPRWGLGYSYPTHTSSALFMCVLLYCYVKKQNLRLWNVLAIEAIAYWIFKNTDSRAGVALAVIAPICFYMLKFTKKPLKKTMFGHLLKWAFPICAIFIIAITLKYNGKGILEKLNRLLSDRLYYSQRAIGRFGVHAFGQRITWTGWGGIGHTQAALAGEYNYVDTSYIKLLLENGVIVWLLIMIAWTATSFDAVFRDDKYLAWALAILAAYCLVEQWLMNIGANPFVLVLTEPIFHNMQRRNRIGYRVVLDHKAIDIYQNTPSRI